MRRHGRRRPGFRQRVFQIRHRLAGRAIEHLADRDRRDQAVVIAAAERRVEEEVAGFLETRQRAQFVGAALHVGMAGLPIGDLRALLLQHRIGHEQPGRFHVDHELRVLVDRRHVARQHHADLVGENLLAGIVDHAAAVAVAVEAEADIGLVRQHRVADGVQHFHVFGIGIVFREGVIEFGVERHHLAADRLHHLRREGARGAVAAGDHDFQLALQLRAPGQIGDVARRKILVKLIRAADLVLEVGIEHDLLQPVHLVGAEGERTVGAHLDAGPAIVVMRRRHHRDAGHVEVELREIRHRRHAQADVVNLAARRQQPRNQRIFDRGRIAAEIMPGDDLLFGAEFRDQRAQPHAQRLNAHQVDFLAEQPAGVVFAKPGRLHHRLGFIGIGIRNQHGFRLRKHSNGLVVKRKRNAPQP